MKKTFFLMLFSAFMLSLPAQEEAKPVEESKQVEESKPERFTIGTGTLMDNQTVATP